MDEKKIVFITCINDEESYEKSLICIKKLHVPEFMEVEIIAIRNAESMTSAYNEAMLKNNSKYKVYLHQDLYIQNTNFIFDILEIFKGDIKIGLIGMVGAKIIPVSGIWSEDYRKVGKICDSHSGVMELVNYNEINDSYAKVKGIDGLMMITQYDLPWREDIFDGWQFYDLSQSVEFIRKGFEIVVPKQQTAWCVHDCGLLNTANGFEEYRNKFLDNYSKDILPLVSILIPAYNQTCFLKQALDSALDQSYRNTEIIICDDSTNSDVQVLVEQYVLKSDKIKYINNGGPCGLRGKNNMEKCFARSSGEYISYLLHDDLYNSNKIDRMINYFLYDDTLSLITSYRRLINEDGEYLNDSFWSVKQFAYDILLTGEEAGRKILFSMNNYIGEPTTSMFRKNGLDFDNIDSTISDYDKYKIYCLIDVALWLKLLRKGNMIYISEPLSKFRIHNSQNSNDKVLLFWASIDYFHLIISSYENRVFIKNRKELLESLTVWNNNFAGYLIDFSNYYNSSSKDNAEILKLKDEYTECYTKFITILLE